MSVVNDWRFSSPSRTTNPASSFNTPEMCQDWLDGSALRLGYPSTQSKQSHYDDQLSDNSGRAIFSAASCLSSPSLDHEVSLSNSSLYYGMPPLCMPRFADSSLSPTLVTSTTSGRMILSSSPQFLPEASRSAVESSPFDNRLLALASTSWAMPDYDISPIVRTLPSFDIAASPQDQDQLNSIGIPPGEPKLATSLFENLLKAIPSTQESPLEHPESPSPKYSKKLARAVLRDVNVPSDAAVQRGEDARERGYHADTLALLFSSDGSPLTPLPDCDTKGTRSMKRRNATPESPTLPSRMKRTRYHKDLSPAKVGPRLLDKPNEHSTQTQSSRMLRTFPLRVPISVNFPLFYSRFPASSYFKRKSDDLPTDLFKRSHPGGTYNCPRSAFDLYTPRFVKGIGRTKLGLCPICIESVERGGEGKQVWLSMKFSAFKWCVPSGECYFMSATHIRCRVPLFKQQFREKMKTAHSYHMQYHHGISAVTARPFSPPIAFRTVLRSRPAKTERSQMMEGKCHRCLKWIEVEGVKDIEPKVKEIFWWKHAAACHQHSILAGEDDIFLEDSIFFALNKL